MMKRHNRIEEIEVLRAIAVLAVFVYHAGPLFYSPGELILATRKLSLDLAVDLFFVISGFVISRELITSIEAARAEGSMRSVVFAFWVRRAFRLLPSAWLSLAFLVLISYVYNSHGFARSPSLNVHDALFAVVHLANFHLYQCMWGAAECGANPVYWSLSLEEQFYLLLPLVLVALGTRSIYFFLAACLIQIFTVRNGWSVLWIVRTDALLIGVLLGYFSKTELYQRLLSVLAKARPLTWLIGAAILCVIPWNPTTHPLWIGITAVLSGILVLLASGDKGLLFPAGYLRSALTWIGARSYAIYLLHIPANILVLESANRFLNSGNLIAGKYDTLLLVASFSLTIALSSLNFRFIETPFRRKGGSLSKRILNNAPAKPSITEPLLASSPPTKR